MNKSVVKSLLLASTLVILSGCATVQSPNPNDPFESFNRGVYSFNQGVDKVVLKPTATAYTAVVPDVVRSCVGNVFGNIGDVWSAMNSFFQGRGHEGINSFGRVLFNSSIGVLGCFDVASKNGVQKVENDFGQTLGVWGVKSGPYLVLPFVGPSSVRDTTGLVADSLGSPVSLGVINDVPVRNSLIGLRLVDTRASLLDATNLLEDVTLDEYSFVRDAFFQRRDRLINRPQAGSDSPPNSEQLPDYSDSDTASSVGDSVSIEAESLKDEGQASQEVVNDDAQQVSVLSEASQGPVGVID